MSNECPRAGRWIGGCKFEPRYDRIPPSEGFAEIVSWALSAGDIIRAETEHIYVADVCTRCGKVIKRDES